jgi:hypothetical protein
MQELYGPAHVSFVRHGQDSLTVRQARWLAHRINIRVAKVGLRVREVPSFDYSRLSGACREQLGQTQLQTSQQGD